MDREGGTVRPRRSVGSRSSVPRQAGEGEVSPGERQWLGRLELGEQQLELGGEAGRVEARQRFGDGGLGEHRGERAQLARRRQHGSDAGHQGGDGRVPGEGHPPGHGLVQAQRERVDVGAVVDRPALDLFGRGVAGRPHDGAEGLGDRRLGERPGQPEVRHAAAGRRRRRAGSPA